MAKFHRCEPTTIPEINFRSITISQIELYNIVQTTEYHKGITIKKECSKYNLKDVKFD